MYFKKTWSNISEIFTVNHETLHLLEERGGCVRPKPDGRINKNWTAEYYDFTAEKIENQTAEVIYPGYYVPWRDLNLCPGSL